MTSVILHRHAVNRCFQDAPLTAAEEEALASLSLSGIAVDGVEDVLDVLTTPEINDAEALIKQINSDADDAVLLAEDEVEAYQDFETATREVIGLIKDDAQLEVGITEEELFAAAESTEDADIDLSAEMSLTEALVDDAEDVDEDEDEDLEISVEKILDMVDSIQDKYEITEAVQDALDAAALKKPEQSEYDESDAFFGDAMPFLEEELVEYALPEFKLNFLWMDKNIGVSVDQYYAKGERAPLTEFFWWPRRDAWEDLRASLDARPWISDRDKVILLNRTTEVINFWQDEEEKHTIDQAREAFTDCSFMGQDG